MLAGTEKTEAAYQIARITKRDILAVNMEKLIDSRLAKSQKNIVKLFDEIGKVDLNRVIIVFDELDLLVLNQIDDDLQKMGSVTSTLLRELDKVHPDAMIIATTNLIDHLDKALIHRFDVTISFDR